MRERADAPGESARVVELDGAADEPEAPLGLAQQQRIHMACGREDEGVLGFQEHRLVGQLARPADVGRNVAGQSLGPIRRCSQAICAWARAWKGSPLIARWSRPRLHPSADSRAVAAGGRAQDAVMGIEGFERACV